MDINFREQQGLDAVLSVKVSPEDYEPGIESNINTYRKDLKLPGFRPGKVPKGIVRKLLLEQMKREQVEKAVQEGVKNFFDDQSMDLLMGPVLKSDDSKIDWKADSSFEFTYEIGIKPDVKIDTQLLQGVLLHKVKAEEKDLDRQIELMREQAASKEDYEEVPDQDEIHVILKMQEMADETTPLEGGVQAEKTRTLKDFPDNLRKELIGKKMQAEFNLNLRELLTSKELESLLEIDEHTATDLADLFQIKINGIYSSTPAELNEAFFKSIFPDKEITDEAAFRAELKELTERYFQQQSQHMARHRIKDTLLQNTPITLPENFLTNWLKRNAGDKQKDQEKEEFKKEFKAFTEEVKWNLINERITKEQDIKIENEEIARFAYEMVRSQFAQYGMGAAGDEMINPYLKNYLSKEENIAQVTAAIRDQKVLDYLEKETQFTEEEISLEQFRELEQHHD